MKIICIRVADAGNAISGSVVRCCEQCNAEVLVAPTSLARRSNDIELVCIPCWEGSKDAATCIPLPVPGAIQEVRRELSREKGRPS